ncbi:MAG: hypothetical protein ACETWE_09615 [Candidatus Bathyarchaeia archaeon]
MKKPTAVDRRGSHALLYAWLFGALIGLSIVQVTASPSTDEHYVFYGYAPSTIVNYTAVEEGIPVYNFTRFPASLNIVGINDTTQVEVYDLTSMELLASKTIDRMELWTVQLGSRETGETVPEAEEAYIKVVSDKIVAVHLGGGPGRPYHNLNLNLFVSGSLIFCPSTDGGFAGKEFIFKAMQTTWGSPHGGEGWKHDIYNIFGIEDGHVTVFDAYGVKVAELDAAAGSFNEMSLGVGAVYRIASTGRILVVGLSDYCFKYLPSLTGGFMGKHFLATVAPRLEYHETVLVIAHEDADVSVYDTTRPGWLIALQGPDVKKSLRSGEYWFDSTMKSGVPARIDSTGKISVLFGKGNGYWIPDNARIQDLGDDISIAGVGSGETFGFYAPTSAIIFATQDCTVEIDDMPIAMRQDEYYRLLPGQHTVGGNAPIIVEILGEGMAPLYSPYGTTWCSWGSYLVSPQGLEVTYPEPPPIGGFGELITYIAAGVAVPIIIIALILIRKKRKH